MKFFKKKIVFSLLIWSKVAATMEKKRSKPKKRVGGRICPDYRVSSDQLCFNQRRFHVSLTKTVSVILCDDTQTPLCHSETKEKKIPLFRQNKLHGLHSTTRWHRAPATALSFMRQLPHFCPPNSGVFKKRLSDADSKSEQKIVTFGFSVLSQFSLIVNRKMSQFGELRQKEKKKTHKMKHQARDDFIRLCRYFNEFNQWPVWLDGTQAVIESCTAPLWDLIDLFANLVLWSITSEVVSFQLIFAR